MPERTARVERKTTETDIEVPWISTGGQSRSPRAFRSSITCSISSVATAASGSLCGPRVISRSMPITPSKTSGSRSARP